MKILTTTFFAIILIPSLFAQVTFTLDSIPDYTPIGDTLYIAGDFQGWNPGHPDFALQKNNDDKWFIEIDSVAVGTIINFKFTRGDWGKVEKGINGEEIPDRQFTFGNGDSISIIIYNWADYGGENSTAAENVEIIDEEFYMPQLDRNRRIWLYLPPDYNFSDIHYPVVYMHDGQNLFDAYTSFAGEWEVDESLNELFEEGYHVPIVVGIDNGGSERINEYTPWMNSQYGGGMGEQYIDFIVETLKPFIDENYRTITDRNNTALWGSSLGGLISHYGVLKFQDVFSKAGIFSPSYWFSDSVWMFTQEMGHQDEMRLYQMAGSLEGGTMVADTWAMHDTLTNLTFSSNELSTKIIPGGQHNEQLWREDFKETYLWLFDSFANDIKEYPSRFALNIIPNPAFDKIVMPDLIEGESYQLFIYDLSGRIVFTKIFQGSRSINVSVLQPGMYLIEMKSENKLYQGKFIKN